MKTELEPQSGSNFFEKKFSRRVFLRGATYGAAGVVAAATVGCDSISSSDEIPTATIPSELPEVRIIPPAPEAQGIDVGGVYIQLDRDGLPSYIVGPDGGREDLDVKSMARLREQAKILGEPEIVKMVPINVTHINTYRDDSWEEEHPFKYLLPKDVLSEYQLSKYGVDIIQAHGTQLHIRKGAFEEGALLSGFADGKRKLQIVLMDSNVVSRHFLNESKYDGVRGKSPGYEAVNVLEARGRMHQTNYERLQKARKELANDDSTSVYGEDILSLKTDEFWISHMITDEEILESQVIGQQLGRSGHYTMGIYIKDQEKEPAVIFLATGREGRSTDYVRIYFDGEGDVVAEKIDYYDAGYRSLPDESETHVSPDSIIRRSEFDGDPNSYVYHLTSAGQFLRHEAGHDYQIGYLGREGSEMEADLKTYESIKIAHDKWIESGDDSGYYFVFSSVDEQGAPGYILTTAESSQPVTRS